MIVHFSSHIFVNTTYYYATRLELVFINMTMLFLLKWNHCIHFDFQANNIFNPYFNVKISIFNTRYSLLTWIRFCCNFNVDLYWKQNTSLNVNLVWRLSKWVIYKSRNGHCTIFSCYYGGFVCLRRDYITYILLSCFFKVFNPKWHI